MLHSERSDANMHASKSDMSKLFISTLVNAAIIARESDEMYQ